MPTKGFNIKTNLGGHKTISTPMGTFQKNGPAYKPRSKQPAVGHPTKPGLGAAPAPAKAASPTVVGQRAAPDSLYNQQVDTAERKGSSRLAELSGNEQSIRHDFGIDDPTNPFSRVEGQKRAFLAKQKASSALLASQGQLYSGTHERAVARTRLEEEQARAGLRSQYDAAINGIGAAKAGVKFDTEEQRSQAFEDWLARAPEAEDIVPQDDGSAPAAAPAPGPVNTHVAAAPGAAQSSGPPTLSRAGLVQRGYLPKKGVNKNKVAAARDKSRADAAKPGKLTGTAKANNKGKVGNAPGFGPVKPKPAPKVKAKAKR